VLYAKLINSFSSASIVWFFAFSALVKIPFSPVKTEMLIAAKIISTIIVIIFHYDYFFKI